MPCVRVSIADTPAGARSGCLAAAAQASPAAWRAPSLSPRKPTSVRRHDAWLSLSGMRSCGRFGPAMDGTT